MKSLLYFQICVALLVLPALAAPVNLPATKVTIFNSGVAYFEHNGQVTDNAQILLQFKTGQINDILKSLITLDFSGTGTADVSYASQEPLARALKSFSVDISGNPTLGALLDQVRGAEVVVMAPDQITGKILGVEKRRQQILPSNTLIEKEFLNLVSTQGLRSIPLDSIGTLALSDHALNDELAKAMALLVESRDADRKSVQVNFTGAGDRKVRIGYITEAPIWKTSYRLVLPDVKADKTRLQGWAILENTSDFDWDNVDLTLVAGRPISFVQDLYTPLYVPRPEVKPELYASLRPQSYDDGLETQAKDLAELKTDAIGRRLRSAALRSVAVPAPAAMAYAEAGRGAGNGEMAADAAMDKQALQQGIEAIASGGSVGDLFSYRIQKPVSISRRKSAMLPIVNQDVRARKVSIYNQSVLPRNPLNGAWLTNDTDLSLLAGPVTVFAGGAYAGDARLDNLAAGEKRLLSYAIDLEMTIDPTSQFTQKIVTARIVRGVLNIKRRDQFTQIYAMKNKSDQPRTVVVEHPRSSDRKLLQPAEPAETTASAYRFEIDIPAAKADAPAEGKLTVAEERVYDQTMVILPYSAGALMEYAGNGEIPDKVRKALEEAARHKNDLALAQSRLDQTREQINAQQKERAQLPPVMNALDRAGQAYKTYEKKLMAIETRLDQLQKDQADQQDKVNQLQKSLEDYLNALDVG